MKSLEHDIQKNFFTRCGYNYKRVPGLDLIHANPNGGLRNKVVAGKLKSEGVKAGVPDVSWPVARGGFIGLAIEFKAPDGNPTKEQRDRMTKMQLEGWCVVMCWSWESAARMVMGYAGLGRIDVIACDD